LAGFENGKWRGVGGEGGEGGEDGGGAFYFLAAGVEDARGGVADVVKLGGGDGAVAEVHLKGGGGSK
jgi:hypothetical protein